MKGITFCTELVPAVLSGEKTVTRRLLMNPQPIYKGIRGYSFGQYQVFDWKGHITESFIDTIENYAPYKVGGIYYIKETWAVLKEYNKIPPSKLRHDAPLWYKTDPQAFQGWRGRWRSGRFMPEWASRGKVLIKSVSAKQVQEITYDEIIKEGCPPLVGTISQRKAAAFDWYSAIWDKLHGKGSWKSNPWCWIYEFDLN